MEAQPFTRAPDSGKTVAVVGGGPAGMACAHRLALFGHKVVVLEAREKAGGLNEYGIAAYKVPDSFAQKELDFILSLGGIEVRNSQMLGRDYSLGDLRRDYDAVFLGIGQAGVNALNLEGETLDGVINAVDFIRDLRQAEDLSKLPVGRKVVVIGGGNTAIDAAVQARRLGAEDVILVYRRGAENMSATHHEQDFAQLNGVKVKHWVMPVALHGHQGRVKEIELEYTQLDEGGRLIGTGDRFRLYVDMVFKAIGQTFLANPLRQGAADMVELDQGRIAVNDERKSSLRDVWAGGDCVLGGQDLTVAAVQDGKVAAESINRYLQA
jgi:glutamate synthase (NADPH/NADH) small chain